ncbi:MAG: transglutaminaseTgpA domain-containing protein [Pseudonocardiaceae bacterium]
MTTRVRVVLSGALAALAGLSFGPVFGPGPAGLPGPVALLAAVLAPVAVAIAWGLVTSLRATRPEGLTSVVGVVGVLVAATVVTRPGADVVSGPYRLLTSALPVEPSGPELAAVSALAGFAALVAVHLALISRSVLAPLVPVLACLVAGLALGAGAGALPGWYPVAFLVLVAGLLTSARWGEGRVARAGSLLGAGVITLVAVVATGLLSSALPGAGRAPADVRDLVGAPVQPRERINPFAQYVALREGLLPVEITGTASAPFERLRMVTLTEFDGRSWSVRADYRRAGRRLPRPAVSVPQRTVEMDVAVRYPETLGWLPSPGRAQQVSVAGLGVDEQTGDVVIPDGRPTPARYQVVAAEPAPAPQALRADQPAPSATPLALDLPPDVLDFVGAATAGFPAGFPRFSALYSRLTESSFAVDESAEATGGHGFYAISALLRDKRGTSEQYASAFALMCRSLGWDARVVLGFRPRFEGTELKVRGEDVHAWVEVRFARLGWVAVDPSPTRTVPGQSADQDAPAPADRADDPITDAIDAERAAPPEPHSPAGPLAPSRSDGDRISGGVLALLIGLAVVLVPGLLALAIPLCKLVRRARRRNLATPRKRALAAWWEVVDRLIETGVPIRRSSTTGDVLGATPGTPQALATLGALADQAAFAPGEFPPAAADAAWRVSDQLRGAIRSRLSPARRLRVGLDPRPLLLRLTATPTTYSEHIRR